MYLNTRAVSDVSVEQHARQRSASFPEQLGQRLLPFPYRNVKRRRPATFGHSDAGASCPLCPAPCSGVHPSPLDAEMSAPNSMSNRASASCPFSASCTGVDP